MTYTEKELDQFLHGISLSLLSKKSAQHWRYDEETAKEIEWLEALERKVRADKADRKTEPMTTNLEWLKTLSAEELADWFYDEWLHHLQYRWSSSRGGLIIWLKDRKTENSSEKPNNSTISKMEQVEDETQTEEPPMDEYYKDHDEFYEPQERSSE